MNDLEQNPPSQPEDAHEKIESLRYQMNLMFGALLIASCTLTAFLGLQARRASLDLNGFKGPAEESIHLVQQDNAAMENTYAKLKEFARAHPDFDKVVLSNFRLNTNNVPAQPAKK